MNSIRFFRYAVVLSLFACAGCNPQSVPIGDELKSELLASHAAPAVAVAAQATVDQVVSKAH
ncbi:putative lipoprotein [Lysobacter antibioticus]|jgi:hypothetical protein|uniref:hypothetical protein n=1 Tax=Lysobacter antibioticus TaxID=84531 RepID=UPI0007171EE1|nr:hypothetical protein [Lysobacter antibioticus]ALN62024.1 putative lipoprotein [Lysobacter antibioticus]